MTKRTVTIEIEQDYNATEADKALDQVISGVVRYATIRAARFLCECAKVTIKQEETQ